MHELVKIIKNGITDENAVFTLALGLCPALAVTTSLDNGLGMGLALIFVLTCSVTIASLVRSVIQPRVRIPVFLAIIACFVTITDLTLKAYIPVLAKSLGIFVPLIVVNCTVLGRVEVFASKQPPMKAFCDGIGMGLGFTMALAVIGIIREVLGAGTVTLLGNKLFTIPVFQPASIMILAPGGFLTIGILMGLIAWYKKKQTLSKIARAKGVKQEYMLPENPPDELVHSEVADRPK